MKPRTLFFGIPATQPSLAYLGNRANFSFESRIVNRRPVYRLCGLVLTLYLGMGLALAETKNYQAVINKASRDLAEGKLDEAATQAAVARKLDPDNPLTTNLLGVIAIQKKDYTEAVAQLNRAIAVDPKFEIAKFNLADVLMLQGDYEGAQSLLDELRQVEPNSEVLQFKLVLAYVLANKTEKASALIDQMPFPGKTPAYYYARAAFWLKRGLEKDAKQYAVNAHKYYTDDQCSYFVRVLQQMGFNVSSL
ncbi:MAG: tetratricopeptide repeat protein [Verrucomicrobia bacterium]|nr:tetratricopeptide repeat protein [Verrucomicrobiota bacterium]